MKYSSVATTSNQKSLTAEIFLWLLHCKIIFFKPKSSTKRLVIFPFSSSLNKTYFFETKYWWELHMNSTRSLSDPFGQRDIKLSNCQDKSDCSKNTFAICKVNVKFKRNLECSIQTNMGPKGLVGNLRLVRLVLENFWRELLPQWFHLETYFEEKNNAI